MRHVTRSWQATVLSGSAEYRGAKHTVVDRWLRVSAQKVSLASVDLPDRSHVAVTTTLTHVAAGHQQSGSPRSDMAERFTVPFRDRMEWLGEPGPSADNAHGHIAGAQSGGTRAPPASSQKNASPRLATDGLDDARSVGGCAMERSFTDYVWRELK